MSRNDFAHLFDRLDALSVGFGPMFRDIQFESSSYPPHNIVKQSENTFILEVAVAGFKKSELTVEELQGVLTIKGTKEVEPEGSYQFRGIGKRNFVKSLTLAEFIEVADAQLADGLLSITLVKNVPEAEKPKIVAIK